jgi:hypothetical protein
MTYARLNHEQFMDQWQNKKAERMSERTLQLWIMSCSVFESNSCVRHPKDKHRDDLRHHTPKPTEDIKIILITLCICTTRWWTIPSSWNCTATCSKTKFTKSKSAQNLEQAVLEVYYQFTIAVAVKSPLRNLKRIAFSASNRKVAWGHTQAVTKKLRI